MSDEAFSRENMTGYAYAAYCAGWKAAVTELAEPGKLGEQHARRWLEANPPAHLDAPTWRLP